MSDKVIHIDYNSVESYIEQLKNTYDKSIALQNKLKNFSFYKSNCKSDGSAKEQLTETTNTLMKSSKDLETLIKNTIIFLGDALKEYTGVDSNIANEFRGK